MKDWKKDLSDFFEKIEKEKQDKEERIEKKKPELKSFYSLKVKPAFKELKTELEKYGRRVEIYSTENSASISVAFKGKKEYSYTMRVEILQDRVRPRPYIVFTKEDGRSYSSEPFIWGNISNVSKDDIREHCLGQYQLHLSGKI